MNRFVRVAAAAALAVGGAGSVGCVSTGSTGGCATGGCAGSGTERGDGAILRSFYDPCWPERYNAVARTEVLAPFDAQMNNGHVLHQTMWNWYFDAGTDKLNGAGMAKLDSIARTRPAPDGRLYLQAARDVTVTAENMDKVGALRDELTVKRAKAVERYLATQPVIGTPVAYEIFVHDPAPTGIPAEFSATAYRGQSAGYRGGIGGGSGTTATATGGGGQTPPASSIGTGPGAAPNAGPSGAAPSSSTAGPTGQ